MERVPHRRHLDRRRHVVAVIHARKLTRRRVGRVRAELADVGEPGRLPRLHPGDKPVGDKRGHAVFARPVGFGFERPAGVVGDVVPKPSQPFQPRTDIVGRQVNAELEAGQDLLIALQPRIGRPGRLAGIHRLIGVAEQGRRITGAPGGLGDVVEARVERRAIADHPVIELIHAGVEAGAAGAAGRALAVVARQAHALRGEAVQMRRPHVRMARGRKAISPELVERDQEYVQGAPVFAHG